jgi:uncharacterized protein YndB with AHSA1/START domain
MKLASRHDVEAPIGQVFAELTNFDQWERAAMRRGADVTRTDTLKAPGPGMTWLSKFRHHSRDRTATLRIDRMETPSRIEMTAMSSLVDADITFELVELSVRRTRLHLSLEMRPKTLASKLYVQSLKLAKGRVERNFQGRVAQFVLELEDRIRRH